MSATTATAPAARTALPSAITLGIARIGIELRQFFREREALIFVFFFPVILLMVFTAAFGNGDLSDEIPGVSVGQYYLPAMIASGILLSSFQSLATTISIERDDGTLKRLRGMPLPPIAYFIGKAGLVIVTSVLQFGLLLLYAGLIADVPLPTELHLWLRFVWIFLLGSAAGAVLGIAFSSIPKSGRSAVAIVTPIVLILQFISGVFFVYYQLPAWMRAIAEVFPLKWLAQGLRSVFLPAEMEQIEIGGSWQLGTGAIVMGVWLLIGVVFAQRYFRWTRRDDG